MPTSPTVAVVGATGVTGTFTFDELLRRGLAPIAIGRNRDKLAQFLKARKLPPERMRVADVHDAGALREALAGIDAVISTVAPFSENGFAVAEAATELGIAYTDCTGEAGFMMRLVHELDARALETGATLCSGNGVAGFLGDIGIQWLTDRDPASSGAVIYEMQDYRPTWGTTRSYLENILPEGGPVIRDGQVHLEPLGAFSMTVAGHHAIHGILPDAIVVSRYWPAHRFDGVFPFSAWGGNLVRAASSAMARRSVRELVMRLPLERLTAYRPARDRMSSVTVTAEVRLASGELRRRSLSGNAIYPLTGAILAATVQAMFRREKRPAGVRAASEMFASFEEAVYLSGVREVAAP
jgi:hypothetical protein